MAALLSSALFASPRQIAAAEIEGVAFPDQYQRGGTTLRLSCTGLLRYMVFIKGYVAALYLADDARLEQVLADQPKRLEIDYFYAIAAPDFVHATERGVAQNTDTATYERLRPKIDQLNALYRDVKPGDRYALTYIPNVGTELALNGNPLGVIAGADFAAALFAIWLGPQPFDASLKSQLLHCSAPTGHG